MSGQNFNKLTIDGVTYTAVDPTKLTKPTNEGTEGQVLIKTANGSEWTYTDYIAFEVYPTDHIIEAGSSELGIAVWGDEDLKVTYAIPASMTEEFSLWITRSRLESDIIIDWGDGVVEKLAELAPTNGTDNDGKTDVLVYVAHTYTVPNKIYTIRVYGKDYCRIAHNSYNLSADNRLVCRILDNDLPIASHLSSLASYCYGCNRLLKVAVPSYSNILQGIINLASCFQDCLNMIYAYGFAERRISSDCVVTSLFMNCKSLIDTDFVFPVGVHSLDTTFTNTFRIKVQIEDLFPVRGFTASNIAIRTCFTNSTVKGTIPANLLWNDSHINWEILNPNQLPFAGCLNAIRAQVPISWGGTASDDIITQEAIYEAGLGINIDDNIISADTTEVVAKSEYDQKMQDLDNTLGDVKSALDTVNIELAYMVYEG